jgi:hypothetical protein
MKTLMTDVDAREERRGTFPAKVMWLATPKLAHISFTHAENIPICDQNNFRE